jgi:hypothetical protein
MRPRRRWLAVAAVLVSAGCLGGDRLAEEDLPRIVLLPSDLPAGFGRFDAGPVTSSRLGAGSGDDPGRFGKVGGWTASYRRAGATPATAGPLVVVSTADVFESPEGAEGSLAAFQAEAQSAGRQGRGPAREVDAPEIGEETLALVRRQEGIQPVLFFTIAWRWSNATGTVAVSGFESRVSLSDAVDLARAQMERFRTEAAAA